MGSLIEARRRLIASRAARIIDVSPTLPGFIRLNREPVVFTPEQLNDYKHTIADCYPGDTLVISGTTGQAGAALLFAVLDRDNMILQTVQYGFVAENYHVEIPDGATKVVINQRASTGAVSASLITMH